MYSDEDEDRGGTFMMEDISGGSLFEETYQCVSASTLPQGPLRNQVEYGNKIVMPTSALETLSRLNIMYPMMFRLTGYNQGRCTFCGVLEFSAPEGVVYLPPWMIKTLKIKAGDLVVLSNTALTVGTYVKIQPQSVDFLDITDPRAVLEHSLRNFAALTIGDCIALRYNDRVYELKVLEVKPNIGNGSICILETDLQVDFAPPVGYQEPSPVYPTKKGEKSIASSLESSQLSTSATTSSTSFAAFQGNAQRLSSRPPKSGLKADDPVASNVATTEPSVAPLALPKGTLYFGSAVKKPTSSPSSSTPVTNSDSTTDAKSDNKFNAFSGTSNRLK